MPGFETEWKAVIDGGENYSVCDSVDFVGALLRAEKVAARYGEQRTGLLLCACTLYFTVITRSQGKRCNGLACGSLRLQEQDGIQLIVSDSAQ